MKSPLLLLPAARSTFAEGYDQFYWFLTILSVVLFVLIIGAMFYFVKAYGRKPGDEKKLSTPTFHSTSLEVFWSVGPLIVCIGIFHFGVKQFMDERVAPANAITVQVRAKKWAWSYEYANGKQATELHAPVNTPVKLILTSQDVIHSYFVPDFRIKYDAIPGRYSMLWFQATSEGESQVFCTEYCGDSHSDMLSKVVVESQEKFNAWLNFDETEKMTLAEVGKYVYEKQACVTCHSTDGSVKTGPSFKGIWGKNESLTSGTTQLVDENYVR